MSYKLDFTWASSVRIETALGRRLEKIRLSRNITQARLAERAGVSTRTIGRLEKGQGVSLDTFIRVLATLGLRQNLEGLLPDPSVRPSGRVGGRERRRARPAPAGGKGPVRSWGGGRDEDD